MVKRSVWEWLCQRWASEEFKNMSMKNTNNKGIRRLKHTGGRKYFVRLMQERREANLVAFYKVAHWSTKKNAFISETAEQSYNEMCERLDEMEPEARTDDATNAVFKEVLGHRSGYVRGLGHLVIPDPSPSLLKNREFQRLSLENEKNKNDAACFKSELDVFKRTILAMQTNFSEVEKGLFSRMSILESQSQARAKPKLADA